MRAPRLAGVGVGPCVGVSRRVRINRFAFRAWASDRTGGYVLSLPPAPPPAGAAKAAARAAAASTQSRNSFITGTLLVGFVGGVFYYCTHAVQQDEITEAELKAFMRARERKREQGR